jgi:hypothetical protein
MVRMMTRYLVIGMYCIPYAAMAVILAGGDGTQNTSAPAGGQGWDYVGRISAANGAPSSVTYIANNWFITANHIKVLDNPTGVVINGSSYPIDPNSWTRLQNSSNGNADLNMFRIVGGSVGLPGLMVRSTATANGSTLTMIGNGRNRQIDETTWNGSWVEGGKPTVYRGYKWAAGSSKRWGTNVKEDDAGLISLPSPYNDTDAYFIDFDDIGGSEAQGATYDSGGGVFYNNSGNWELAGIMIAIANFGGQPIGSSVYGNLTYIADMQYYAAQIEAISQITDIDEDGIPDDWEYEKSGSTIGVEAAADQDSDGYTGTQEWIADTNPTDGTSYLRILSYTNVNEVAFNASTDRQYRIEYRSDLADTNETWLTEVDWFDPGSTQTVISVSASADESYYRVGARL